MVTIKYNMTEFATYQTLWLIHVITTKILEMRLWHSSTTRISRLIREILTKAFATMTPSKITRVVYQTLIGV